MSYPIPRATCSPCRTKSRSNTVRGALRDRATALLLAIGACSTPADAPPRLGSSRSLTVLPATRIAFEGEPGGPFRPEAVTCTLRNSGGGDLRWTVEGSEGWVGFEGPSGGVLHPQASVSVQVVLRSEVAAALPAGSHTAVVRFVVPDAADAIEPRDVILDIATATGDWVSSSGWTTFTPSADTVTIHVSSSSGDDQNDGLSPASPKRTIAAGKTPLRHGYPDWLLLKRGDVWQENLGHWKKSGRSSREPMLVSTYGSATARPLLQTGSTGGIWTMSGGGSPATIDNLALVGLHFLADTFSGSGDCVGARMLQPGSHFLIEDCEFERYGTNLVFQAFSSSGSARHQDFQLRRSTIADAHCVHGTGAHPQGLYALGVDGLLVEECVFDHNGWSEPVPGAGADIFSHNIYIDNGNTNVVVRGNIIANASSHGMQLRCGGSVVNNLFVRNSIALLVGGGNDPEPGGVRADVRGNVIQDGKNIDDANPRGWGMCFANIAAGRVTRNVIANNTLGKQPVALTLAGTQSGDTRPSIGVHDLSIERNILFNWGGGVVFEGGAKQIANIEVHRNDIQDLLGREVLVEHFDPASIASVRWAGNRFHSRLAPGSGWMRIGGTRSALASRQLSGNDSGAVGSPVTYPDPMRSVASYHRSLRGAETHEAFLDQVRAQSKATWRPELTADAVNRYLREGFGLAAE